MLCCVVILKSSPHGIMCTYVIYSADECAHVASTFVDPLVVCRTLTKCLSKHALMHVHLARCVRTGLCGVPSNVGIICILMPMACT
jgi:hypothetical protein